MNAKDIILLLCLLSIPSGQAAPVAEPLPKVALKLAFPNLTANRPIWLCEAPDRNRRLFLAEQDGRVWILPTDRNSTNRQLVLDISDRKTHVANEEGLLGFAFHPKFKSNRKLYVHYSGHNPRRSIISEFQISKIDPNRADAASERILWEIPQPYDNHNGGPIVFGPDGYLYIGLGDGGTIQGDPHNNGQRLDTLLGKILRIDVDGKTSGLQYRIPKSNPFVGTNEAQPEIFALGMRNPWRMSFDRKTGKLWAGDVGQEKWEEIDIIEKGGNYGWRLREGFHPYKTNDGPASVNWTDPIVEYPHNPAWATNHVGSGMSVTGGYVYRGKKLPHLYGVYLYADFVSCTIWGLRYENKRVTTQGVLVFNPTDVKRNIASFGEDESGEIYILAFDGKIYELVEVQNSADKN
jgi:glucose/arabinose dehydrogenase